ncbi:MAG: hypothetical protein IKY43_00595 [Bacteroidales bacterium]|nr:hypothetical protein [Bacteroidales bacterium]
MKNRAKIMMMALTLVALLGTAKAQTELYKKYEHLEDVTVVCIMKLPINDTMTAQVTLLAPHTKEAVYTLAEEFNLGIEKDIIDKTLGDEYSGLSRRIVYKNDVKKRYGDIESPDDYKNISRLIYNYSTGTLLIFHDIDTEERFTAISELLTDVLTNPEKFPTIDNVKNKNK